MRVSDPKNLAHSVTEPENILLEERRQRVLALRVAGFTLQQIADQIEKEYGEKLPRVYNTQIVHNDLTVVLQRRDIESSKFILETKQIELERLDALWLVAYNMALGGDIKAMAMCIKIMERKAKFIGADAPEKLNVRDWRTEILELIRSGKFSIEQVRDELGTEIYTRLLESGNDNGVEGSVVDSESRDVSES